MADRHTFHFNHLEPFKKWLDKNKWEFKPPSHYEVLKATKNKDWIIIYKKLEAKEHYTLTERSIYFVNKWFNELKIRKQVCDEIKKYARRNYETGNTNVLEYLISPEDLELIEKGEY